MEFQVEFWNWGSKFGFIFGTKYQEEKVKTSVKKNIKFKKGNKSEEDKGVSIYNLWTDTLLNCFPMHFILDFKKKKSKIEDKKVSYETPKLNMIFRAAKHTAYHSLIARANSMGERFL